MEVFIFYKLLSDPPNILYIPRLVLSPLVLYPKGENQSIYIPGPWPAGRGWGSCPEFSEFKKKIVEEMGPPGETFV